MYLMVIRMTGGKERKSVRREKTQIGKVRREIPIMPRKIIRDAEHALVWRWADLKEGLVDLPPHLFRTRHFHGLFHRCTSTGFGLFVLRENIRLYSQTDCQIIAIGRRTGFPQ